MTARMQAERCSTTASFSTTPRAPSCSASRICRLSTSPVKTMVRVEVLSLVSSRNASMPGILGMARSSSRMSGRRVRTMLSASAPSLASATIRIWLSACSMLRKPMRTTGWSSAIRTLMGVTATFAIVIVFADDRLGVRFLARKHARTEYLHVFLLHCLERGGKLIEHCFRFTPIAGFPHRFQAGATSGHADGAHDQAAALQVVGPVAQLLGLFQCKCIAQLCKCFTGLSQKFAANLHQLRGPGSCHLS